MGGGLGLVEIGDMDQSARLFLDRFHYDWVTVPERAHGDACAEIEVAAPLFIPNARAFPLH